MQFSPCCSLHAQKSALQITDFSERLMTLNRMFVCQECGNKRCPKATDCTLDCTQSNDPGQQGSSYDFPNDVMDVTGRDIFNLVYTANMARQFNVYNLSVQKLVVNAAASANIDVKVLYGSLSQRTHAGMIPSYETLYNGIMTYSASVVKGELSALLLRINHIPYDESITQLANKVVPFRGALAENVYSVNRHRFIQMASHAVAHYKERNRALPCITSLTHNVSASAQKNYREGIEAALNLRICGQARLPIKELSAICNKKI
jgi:hypothetical protein